MKYKIIARVCKAISEGELNLAKSIIEREYPHEPIVISKKKISEYQSVKIFLRDAFIDRYSGERLIFPPVLRIISELLPDDFPFHSNWKMSECHIFFWYLIPTIDHIIPIARGGNDSDDNLVTTSMMKNLLKSNWLLEEIGWHLHPSGKLSEWDGLIYWFIEYIEKNPRFLRIFFVNKWHKALKKALNTP